MEFIAQDNNTLIEVLPELNNNVITFLKAREQLERTYSKLENEGFIIKNKYTEKISIYNSTDIHNKYAEKIPIYNNTDIHNKWEWCGSFYPNITWDIIANNPQFEWKWDWDWSIISNNKKYYYK